MLPGLAAIILVCGILAYGFLDLFWTKYNQLQLIKQKNMTLQQQNDLIAIHRLELEVGLTTSHSLKDISTYANFNL